MSEHQISGFGSIFATCFTQRKNFVPLCEKNVGQVTKQIVETLEFYIKLKHILWL